MLNNSHPNAGMIVFVTQDVVVSTTGAIFMRFYPSCTLRLVGNYEEALSMVDALPTSV
jgi:hypothetical protein